MHRARDLILGAVAGSALVAALTLPATAAGPAADTPGPDVVSQLVVATRDGRAPSAAELREFSRLTGVSVRRGRDIGGGFHTLTLAQPVGADRAADLAQTLAGVPGLDSVSADLRVQPADAYPGPPEARSSEQWDIWDETGSAGGYSVRAPAAWPATTGTPDTVVAVIDTGITDHPDLAGQTVPGYDFIADPASSNDGDGWDDDPSDEGDYDPMCSAASSWHGTHVTGTIVAAQDGQGMVGVAPGTRVQMVRVLGGCGGALSDLAAAIRWAAGDPGLGVPVNRTPARVISMSLAATMTCPPALRSAISFATGRDISVVAAAGNEAVDVANATPANCPGVLAVAATGRAGQRASYSNSGTDVAIAAPGGSDGHKVLSTSNTGTMGPAAPGYRYMMGTSMATPHVAGALALVRSAHPGWSAAQAWGAVAANARPFPEGTVRDCTPTSCGVGLLDLVGLLPDPAGTAVIGGHVRRAGVAVRGVDVTASAPDGTSYYGHTDADGAFRVAVPTGEYVLRFTQGPATTTTGSFQVTQDSTGHDLAWPALGSLEGTVTAAGTPQAGVEVGVASMNSATAFRTVTTDAAGHFRIPDLAAGTYRLQARGSAIVTTWLGGSTYSTATGLAVTDGVEVAGLEFPVISSATVAPAVTSAGPPPPPAPETAIPTPTPSLTPAPVGAAMPVPMLSARLGKRPLPARVAVRKEVTLTARVAAPATEVEFSDSAGVLGTAPVISGAATLRTRLRGGAQSVTARVHGPAAGAASPAVAVVVVDRGRPKVSLRWAGASHVAASLTAKDSGGLARVAVRTRTAGNWGQWQDLALAPASRAVVRVTPAGWDGRGCIAVRVWDWAGNASRTVKRCTSG